MRIPGASDAAAAVERVRRDDLATFQTNDSRIDLGDASDAFTGGRDAWAYGPGDDTVETITDGPFEGRTRGGLTRQQVFGDR